MKNDRLVLTLAIIVGLAIYTALVFAFFGSEGESRLVYLFMLGMPLAVLLLVFPRSALILLTALVFSVRWLHDPVHLLPREATWLVDILIAMLVIRTMFTLPFGSEKFNRIFKLIILLMIFAMLSALVNHIGPRVLVTGVRSGFRYIFLFVAAYQMRVSVTWLRRYIGFLFFICLFQMPVVAAQFLQYGWSDPDRISGTLGWGETGGMGLFLLTLVTYLMNKMVEEGHFRVAYLAAIAAISVLPVLGEVKFYFLLMPLLLMFIVRSEIVKRPSMVVLIALTGLIIIFGANYAILRTGAWIEGRNPVNYIMHLPDVFSGEMEKEAGGTATRTSTFVNTLRLSVKSPKVALIGEGPGSITESLLFGGRSPKLAYYGQWTISAIGASSFCWMVIEYGYVGTALVGLLIFWIYRRGKVLRASLDMNTRIMGRTLEAVTLLYVAWQFYDSAWISDVISFPYWAMAGMLVSLSYQEQAIQKTADLERIRALAHPAQPEGGTLPTLGS